VGKQVRGKGKPHCPLYLTSLQRPGGRGERRNRRCEISFVRDGRGKKSLGLVTEEYGGGGGGRGGKRSIEAIRTYLLFFPRAPQGEGKIEEREKEEKGAEELLFLLANGERGKRDEKGDGRTTSLPLGKEQIWMWRGKGGGGEGRPLCIVTEKDRKGTSQPGGGGKGFSFLPEQGGKELRRMLPVAEKGEKESLLSPPPPSSSSNIGDSRKKLFSFQQKKKGKKKKGSPRPVPPNPKNLNRRKKMEVPSGRGGGEKKRRAGPSFRSNGPTRGKKRQAWDGRPAGGGKKKFGRREQTAPSSRGEFGSTREKKKKKVDQQASVFTYPPSALLEKEKKGNQKSHRYPMKRKGEREARPKRILFSASPIVGGKKKKQELSAGKRRKRKGRSAPDTPQKKCQKRRKLNPICRSRIRKKNNNLCHHSLSPAPNPVKGKKRERRKKRRGLLYHRGGKKKVDETLTREPEKKKKTVPDPSP